MVSNVFGNPITNDTLKHLPEYQGKTITRLDRAKVALSMKKSDNKDKQARDYVQRLKREWGIGVSTLCVIYNATGDTITLFAHHDWYGHIGPEPYPNKIANGQWGAFLHVKTSGAASGSCACVVYKGLQSNGIVMYWLAGWSNPWSRFNYDNTVCAEILKPDFISLIEHEYDNVYHRLRNGDRSDSHRLLGCESDVKTESDTSPICEAIFTLYY